MIIFLAVRCCDQAPGGGGGRKTRLRQCKLLILEIRMDPDPVFKFSGSGFSQDSGKLRKVSKSDQSEENLKFMTGSGLS